VLVIDEINRADISQVLGPLIAAIEADKRLGSEFPVPFNVRYDRSASHEWVPANLHIVGTMNSADRNIALVDVALRRRFEFARLDPDERLVPEWTTGVAMGDRLSPRRLLRALNLRIDELLGPDFAIGHSYFMDATTNEAVVEAFAKHILPLLQEYFYGDDTALLLTVGEHPDDSAGGDCIFQITKTEPAELDAIFGSGVGATAAAYLTGSAEAPPFRLRVRASFWDSTADPPRPGDPASAARALAKIYSPLLGAEGGTSPAMGGEEAKPTEDAHVNDTAPTDTV
jgi:5-methylcytosine-specific restriction protein B